MAEGRVVRRNFSNANKSIETEAIPEIKAVKSVDDGLANAKKDFSTSLMGMQKDPVLITETCKLPSRGLLYGGVIGDTVELRAMTTIEERMRLSGENFWSTMAGIVNRCLVNCPVDAKDFVDFDFFAILVKLRIITYGNGYKVRTRCLNCEKAQDITVNLDLLNIENLPDDFIEPIIFEKMPKSGDKLGIRFLRVFDHIDMELKSNEYNNSKKGPEDLGDPKYTLEMERMLVSVNDVELDSLAKHKYISTMIGMDSSYFHNRVNKLFYGVRRVGTMACEDENCGGLVLYQVAPDENFFRTAFDD